MCILGTGWARASEAGGPAGAGSQQLGVQGSPLVLPAASAGLIRKVGGLG